MAKAPRAKAVKKERVDVIKKARLYKSDGYWFAYSIVSKMRVAAADTEADCIIRAERNGYEVVH